MHLLDEFERLSPSEQREFSDAIVHRAARFDYSEVSDQELTASAARMFAMLDEEEDAQGWNNLLPSSKVSGHGSACSHLSPAYRRAGRSPGQGHRPGMKRVRDHEQIHVEGAAESFLAENLPHGSVGDRAAIF